MDFDPLCLCVWVVQKGTVQIYVKPVTGISTTLMKEVIILHCRVVYQSNVLPGQWAWLGMQSFSDYEFCGVVVRDGGGGGERERGRLNPRKLKKRRNVSEPSIFTSSLFLINKWIPFCCASVQQDVTDAASTKRKHKMRSSFLPFT